MKSEVCAKGKLFEALFQEKKIIGDAKQICFWIFVELVLLQIIERLKEKKLTVPKRLIFKKCS
jgi:hypothetical protein